MAETALPKKVMAIRLRRFGRICPITGYKEENIRVGSPVIIQTDRGVEIGEIISFLREIPKTFWRDVKLKKVMRYATPEDLRKMETLPDLEAKTKKIAAEKVREHELPIKIVEVEYLFDTNYVLVYYKVEENKKAPNLRDLGRDLSTTIKAHVELQQISPRDEARLLGGLGPCGRQLCCSVWLNKPKHVTVKMVKDQGLAISPTKTSGICGRLMCCLEYEYEK